MTPAADTEAPEETPDVEALLVVVTTAALQAAVVVTPAGPTVVTEEGEPKGEVVIVVTEETEARVSAQEGQQVQDLHAATKSLKDLRAKSPALKHQDPVPTPQTTNVAPEVHQQFLKVV